MGNTPCKSKQPFYLAFLSERDGLKKWRGFFLRRRIALCSLKRMPVLTEYHVIDFQQIHWLRGKIPLICCREQKPAFFQSVALTLWFCCLCERSAIILVEMFSDMCCLEDNASPPELSDKHSGSIRDGWLREEEMLKKWVIFTFCVFLFVGQVTGIYIAVEETLLGFVLSSKLLSR